MRSQNLKIAIFVLFQFLFLDSLNAQSAHEYAESTHVKVIEIIKTEQQLFLNNPEEFTSIISNAFSPIVDFNRIARSVMVNTTKKLLKYKEIGLVRLLDLVF